MKQNAEEEGVPLDETRRRLCGYRRLREQSDDNGSPDRNFFLGGSQPRSDDSSPEADDGSPEERRLKDLPESPRWKGAWRPFRARKRRLGEGEASGDTADTEAETASSAAAAAKSSASAARELAAAIKASLEDAAGEGALFDDVGDGPHEGKKEKKKMGAMLEEE